MKDNSNTLKNTMTTIAPSKVTLTCKVTGKQVIWVNKALIQKQIDKHGSLEAWVDQFVSREGKSASKTPVVKASVVKPLLEQGVELGTMTQKEYEAKYTVRTQTFKDGTTCTVAAPKPPAPVFSTACEPSHAGAKAVAAVSAP